MLPLPGFGPPSPARAQGSQTSLWPPPERDANSRMLTAPSLQGLLFLPALPVCQVIHCTHEMKAAKGKAWVRVSPQMASDALRPTRAKPLTVHVGR